MKRNAEQRQAHGERNIVKHKDIEKETQQSKRERNLVNMMNMQGGDYLCFFWNSMSMKDMWLGVVDSGTKANLLAP